MSRWTRHHRGSSRVKAGRREGASRLLQDMLTLQGVLAHVVGRLGLWSASAGRLQLVLALPDAVQVLVVHVEDRHEGRDGILVPGTHTHTHMDINRNVKI